MRRFSTMSEMTEPTVDDLPAEADALEVVWLELDRIEGEDVRDPHRHAYHELIWVLEGSGRHLIDGAPVEFGPRTLTVIAKGEVHQFERAEGIRGYVVRFDDEWLSARGAGSSPGRHARRSPCRRTRPRASIRS